MSLYRTVLVWLMRAAALTIAGWAGWRFYETNRAYEAALAYPEPAETAGSLAPLDLLPELIAAFMVGLLCLTLAEILALLAKRSALELL